MIVNKNMSLEILIIDDYPMTVRGYSILLKDMEFEYSIYTDSAFNCDEALLKINNHKEHFYDIVLLDINLPASSNNVVVSGLELGVKIKTKFPKTKIIVHTGINDYQRISNIFKILNPEGFLIKSDIEPGILFEAIRTVLSDNFFYSERTNRLLSRGRNQDIFIDSWDNKILYHLSLGEKMKELPKHIPLSMATIERRKKNLKMLFEIPDGNTKQLLEIARKKGFI